MKAKLTRLNIRIDYDLKDKIEKEAEEAGITQTDLVLNAIEARIERELLVKKELAEWKIETQISLKNWEHKQYYRLELLRLNCLHGVFPASIYDNPSRQYGGFFETKLEDLNKPTVVPVVAVKDDKPTVVSLKDEDTNPHRTVPSTKELQEQLNKIDARMKREAPVEDEDTNTDRNDDIPKVKSILEGIEEKMEEGRKSLEDSLKDS